MPKCRATTIHSNRPASPARPTPCPTADCGQGSLFFLCVQFMGAGVMEKGNQPVKTGVLPLLAQRSRRASRSEERRVGQGWVSIGRSRWAPAHQKKKNQQIHETSKQKSRTP